MRGEELSWLSSSFESAEEVLVGPFAYPHSQLDDSTAGAYQGSAAAVLVGVMMALAVAFATRSFAPRPKLRAFTDALPGLGAPVQHSGTDFHFLSWSPDVRDPRDRTTMPIFRGDAVVAGPKAAAPEPVASVSGSLLPGKELRFSSASGTWAAVRRASSPGGAFDVLDTADALCAEVWKLRSGNGHEPGRWTVDGTGLAIIGSFADQSFLIGKGFVKVLSGNNVAAQVEARNDEQGNASFHCSVDASADVTLILASLVSLAEFETIAALDA